MLALMHTMIQGNELERKSNLSQNDACYFTIYLFVQCNFIFIGNYLNKYIILRFWCPAAGVCMHRVYFVPIEWALFDIHIDCKSFRPTRFSN